MMLRVSVMLMALLAAVATAQNEEGPRITGATQYKPHSLVRLKAEGVDPKAGVLWKIYPSTGVERANTHKFLCEFAAHPGDYEVSLIVFTQTAEGAFDIVERSTKVTISSCHPPIPPPNPNPPGPTPPNPNPPGPGPKLDPSNAIGQIQFGTAGCSATVIGPRRADGRWNVVTAAHCNSGVGQRGTMKMPSNGARYNVRVVAHNKNNDLCWMVTEESIDIIEYANMATANPAVGVEVWHQGYGFHLPRNREEGRVTAGENGGQLQFVLNVSSGDSGGGIFRKDTNEWVSAVCCTQGIAQKTYMYGGSVEQARKMLSQVQSVYDPNPAPSTPAAPLYRVGDDWEPVDIPVVKRSAVAEPEWVPVPMPLVREGSIYHPTHGQSLKGR